MYMYNNTYTKMHVRLHVYYTIIHMYDVLECTYVLYYICDNIFFVYVYIGLAFDFCV